MSLSTQDRRWPYLDTLFSSRHTPHQPFHSSSQAILSPYSFHHPSPLSNYLRVPTNNPLRQMQSPNLPNPQPLLRLLSRQRQESHAARQRPRRAAPHPPGNNLSSTHPHPNQHIGGSLEIRHRAGARRAQPRSAHH